MQTAYSSYRPGGQAYRGYPASNAYYGMAPSQQYNGYQTLSPSTFYPASPTVYSSRVTATPGVSSYSGYVFDPSMPPGRTFTSSTRRSSRRRPQQYATGRPSYAPSAASATAQRPYAFNMAAYGPPQPHAHQSAPTASSMRVPARTRITRRPSQANLGQNNVRISAGRAGRRTICSMFGKQLVALSDVWAGLFGLGPSSAARRVASAAAKLHANPTKRRKDAAWRAQLEDVICRECARLLEYAQSHVYSTQMQSLDALNALANEYHVVLRCLARIGARQTLDNISELIRSKRSKIGSGPGTYSRDQIHQLRVRCSTLKQRLRYRNRERRSE